MDRVKFDAVTEIVARLLKQKSDEVIQTKKVMLKGGLFRFDADRLINDLEQLIEEVKLYAPEGFVETFPMEQDAGQPDTTE
jgi:signal transduction histidine kinase